MDTIKKSTKYSIICVYRDREIYEKYLLDSILKQDYTDYELLSFDNSKNKLESIAQGYNYTAEAAIGEYLIFMHSDVTLNGINFFQNLDKYLNDKHIFGAVGVGSSPNPFATIGNGNDIHKNFGLNYWTKIDKITQVQSVDGVLIIIPSKIFDVQKSDEKTCNGWHLYDIDYCLDAENTGIKTYVIPMDITHYSDGTTSQEYYKVLLPVLRKHCRIYKIYTCPCGLLYPNSLPLNILYLGNIAIRSYIGKLLGRNTVGSKRFIIGIKYIVTNWYYW